MSDEQDGYTLLELVVVLAVLALVSTLGLNFVSRESSKKSTQTLVHQLEAIFRETRTQAIALHSPESVQMKLGDRIELMRSGNTVYSELLEGRRIVVTSGRFGAADSKLSTFIFFPNGTSTGGQISISDRNIRAVLELSWLTGLTNVSFEGLSGEVAK